jgi:cyclophilin family peptidyl-prolyl cis-trans isomerase
VVTEDNRLYQFRDIDLPATVAPGNPLIKITTSYGTITAELFEDKTPNTVANMLTLAEKGFYKDMTFHRVIKGFMAQGGCPHSKPGAGGRPGTGGPGYRFADEFVPELKHDGRGVLSMANSGPNTNGSQFFLCFAAAPHLDGRHTVFGKVIEGLEVLDKLEAAETGQQDRPLEDILFDIRVVRKQDHGYEVQKLGAD